tara:strand:+ start:3511 stop:3768 length:258 start_codon:yes stop_codon:yes gene_type:complete
MSIDNHLPSGWLVDPKGDRMVLFLKDPMSAKNLPKFYIDKWTAIKGSRSKFKFRKISLQDEAIRIWNNLIDDGWNKVENVVNKAA